MRNLLGALLATIGLWMPSAVGQVAAPADARARSLPPAYATNQLDLEIPFKISGGSSSAAQAVAVQVYVSWDHGRNWRIYTEVPPDAGKFRFRAKKDAEFWFVTETKVGTSSPPQDAPKTPQLRLVIDTQKPDLQATAAINPSGQVEVTWDVADPNLIPQTLRIEYQDARAADGPWEPVTIPASQMSLTRGGLAGRVAFAPLAGLRSIHVRAEVADAAGNKSYFHQQLAIPISPGTPRGQAPTPSPLAFDASARRWPSDNRMPADSHPSDGSLDVERIARPPARDDREVSGLVTNPHVRRDRLTAGPSAPAESEELVPPRPALGAADDLPPPREERLSPFPKLSAPAVRPSAEGDAESFPAERVPAGSRVQDSAAAPVPDEEPLPPPAGVDTQRRDAPGPDVTTSNSIPAGSQPRLTNAKRFALDYDVESVGPEGVAEVELWGTNDGGKTWLKWGTDPDRISPMDVEVANEATYGFRVVILGKNGLEGNKPRSGDDADLWVSIDVTPPLARITSAAYGSGADAGKLDIRWEADDANLGQRSVTLLYSDRPEGKPTVIAAGLENTGRYLWQFDPRSPRTIYLRLEVRDDAGNVGQDALLDPISIEGLIPKGRIRSLSPVPEPVPSSGVFQSPLFR